MTNGAQVIGIISHLDELSLRLPARVRVQKGSKGSQITVEAA